MSAVLRTTILAAVIGGLALTLSACGSSAPATSITSDGSYTIGEDIAVGTLTRGPGATGAASCLYKIDNADGTPFGVSQSVKDMAAEQDSWFAPKSVLSRGTLKPLGPGLPLVKGFRLTVRDCGQLVIA